MAFSGQNKIIVGWKWISGTATDSDNILTNIIISDGSGSGEADGSWNSDPVTLLSGTTTTYDLTALPKILFGASVEYEFSRVISLVIKVDSTSTGTLVVGGASSNTWIGPFADTSDKIQIEPNSNWYVDALNSGWTVSGTVKNLKLEASGGDVLYTLAIVGNPTLTQSGS